MNQAVAESASLTLHKLLAKLNYKNHIHKRRTTVVVTLVLYALYTNPSFCWGSQYRDMNVSLSQAHFYCAAC